MWRSADVRVWRSRSAGVKVWRSRSAGVKVWRSRSADVRVWRCRSADVKVWRCRSADVKVSRCRSADVKVWRCITAAFLRRTLRRRSREKHFFFATFLPFRVPVSSFFWPFLFYSSLFCSSLLWLFSSLLFHLLLFSSLTLLTSAFPSAHIVGSLTSKLPSAITIIIIGARYLLLRVVPRKAVAEVSKIAEGSLEVKLPTIWTDEKQRWEESERREE